jgi:tetratricopeptide (TPR) repeat protein
MLRAEMISEASKLLCDPKFAKGRLFALGRENGTRRQIKDCECLFDVLSKKDSASAKRRRADPKSLIKSAYCTIGGLLKMDEEEYMHEEGSPEAVEVGRCHFELGFSLAEKRCWAGAIFHWEQSQEFLVSSLGMVELVAGILYGVGSVYCEMHEYEQALGSLKQCLRIRGAIHGEEHILYAQSIQKIGDIFLAMSDYHEATESYNWALDVMVRVSTLFFANVWLTVHVPIHPHSISNRVTTESRLVTYWNRWERSSIVREKLMSRYNPFKTRYDRNKWISVKITPSSQQSSTTLVIACRIKGKQMSPSRILKRRYD